jgi:anthranilate synthase component 1
MTDTTFGILAQRIHAGDKIIPVARELFADAETPLALYRKLAESRPGTFLLESAEQGGIWSRFSFVGTSSFGVLTEVDGVAEWIDTGLSAERAFGGAVPRGTVDAIEQLYKMWQTPLRPGSPPLTGGFVGYIGWEAVRQLERLPDGPPSDTGIPGVGMSFARDLISIDHKFGTVTLIVNVLNDGAGVDELWLEAQARLDDLQRSLAAPTNPSLAVIDLESTVTPRYRTDRIDFLDSVATAKDHIVAGDVFQVVVSQRFDLDSEADPLDVYRVLRSLNPSPYMYLLSLPRVGGENFSVIGSSPEALVKVIDGRVFTHPIAGSRPRGSTPEDDLRLEEELLADQKERSEHLMLVDLARNDLLRVCTPGTVDVTEFMRIERFSHIMHIVSSVEGDLAEDKTPIDVFRATFPAGTLSGAPKPRALEIIDQLEPARRGVYGGVVGYFAPSGDADLAIAIRTVTLIDGVAHVQAGAGLVADSDPESEYQETEHKAAAPLRAVAIANRLKHV